MHGTTGFLCLMFLTTVLQCQAFLRFLPEVRQDKNESFNKIIRTPIATASVHLQKNGNPGTKRNNGSMIVFSINPRTGCPGNVPDVCTCRQRSKGWHVQCSGGEPTDVIRRLPLDTVTLTYVIDGPVNFSGLRFRRLKNLETLMMTSRDTATYSSTPTRVISQVDIFEGLDLLERLHIHVYLDFINPKAFVPLKNLTVMDLSHTRNLNKTVIGNILEVISQHELPVRDLLLRNFQHPNPSTAEMVIHMHDDILRHLHGSKVRNLDISMNGLVIYDYGLIQHLPTLESIRSLNNIGSNRSPFWACVGLDIALHPALRHIEMGSDLFSFEKSRNKRMAAIDLVMRCLKHFLRHFSIKSLLSGNVTCEIVSCVCQDVPAIPCEYVPKFQDVVDLGDHCTGFLKIPLLSMETFIFSRAILSLYGNLIELTGTEKLCLANNSLKYFDFSGNDIGIPASFKLPKVQGATSLWYLNLQYNKIHFNDFSVFEYFQSVQVLLLGGNYVPLENDTQSEMFRHTRSLIVLDLAECGLTELKPAVFSQLDHLQVLNLSQNTLQDFNPNLRHMKELRLLNLSHNSLTVLGPDVRAHLSDLFTQNKTLRVDLSYNPSLSCRCADLQFIQWMQKYQHRFLDRENVQCNHPTLGLVLPWRINTETFHRQCHPSHLDLILYTFFATIGLVVFLCVSVCLYHRRWKIRYYLHAARQSWNQKRSASDRNPDQYVFDAFLVYNTNDRLWVHDILTKTLENEHHLKLCVHYRNFIPGRDIADTIVESIEKSRKTVLVLSPNFLRSNWCHYEFRMARQVFVEQGREDMVLILLQSVAGCTLSRPLSLLLQERTYVEWTDDPDGQRLFWSQLRAALE